MTGRPLLDMFLMNMAWASALMLLVLAARRPFASAFGAGPAYALWLLPAFRLAVPALPDWGLPMPDIFPAQTLILWVDGAALSPPHGEPWQGTPLLFTIWAVGVAAFIVWQLVAYRGFVGEVEASARPLGDYRGLSLIESAAVQGPVALGLIRRRIVVPADFESRYSAKERSLALYHERVHHRRGDIWWNHLALVVLALNWFNPIAWIAFRAFRADQELACDAVVAASASPEARSDYARALVKSASRPGLIAACPLNHADQLKRRLEMMKFHKESRLRMAGGAAAVLVLGGFGLAIGTPAMASQQPAQARPEAEQREERVIVRSVRRDGHRDQAAAHGEAGASGQREQRVRVFTHREGDGPGHGDHPGGEGDQHATMLADCNGPDRHEVDEGTDTVRTRVILCTRGARSPADRVSGLQRARDQLASETELSAEQRSRVLAALDAEIARLRRQ
jgi:beta-lactamase regulating signal transducer with metallopeptidase domain